MLRTRGVEGGWGGVGWDVDVHVNLRQQLMLRTRGVGGGVGWDVNVHVNLRQQLMTMMMMMILMMMMTTMMMIMTPMKLVNSATKFRHGMDKFYQPNSGLRGSRSLDEATYTYTHTHIYRYIYIYIMYKHIMVQASNPPGDGHGYWTVCRLCVGCSLPPRPLWDGWRGIIKVVRGWHRGIAYEIWLDSD